MAAIETGTPNEAGNYVYRKMPSALPIKTRPDEAVCYEQPFYIGQISP
jgi:hypothetical protein